MNELTMKVFLAALYLVTLGGLAFSAVRISAQAAPPAAEAGPVRNSYYEEWYELSADQGELTLRLENHIPGYSWKVGSSNDRLLRTTDYYYNKYDDRIITMVPAAGSEGDVTLTVSCMKDLDTKPIDRRQLSLHVAADGTITVR